MHYPSEDYSSGEEGLDSDVQLLHVTSLEMNSINNKQSPRENYEWWEVVRVGNSSLHCQLDTGSYASVFNTSN